MDYNIKPPKTMRKDFENYLAEGAYLNKRRESGDLTQREYRLAVRELEAKYADKIYPEDHMLFENEKDFSDFLAYLTSRSPKNKENLQWALNHEREHYEAVMNDPGIRAQYCFWILREDDGDTSGLPAVFVESLKDDDHYLQLRKKSVEAATEPSPGDKLEL